MLPELERLARLTEPQKYLLARCRVRPNGCWLWTGAKDKDGYGYATVGGVVGRAHRAAYTAFVGPIPRGKLVLHTRTCRSSGCINPAHLYVGTQKQNIADMDALGRRVGNVRLSARQVAAIRASALSQSALARRYKVSQTQIWRIVHRMSWR